MIIYDKSKQIFLKRGLLNTHGFTTKLSGANLSLNERLSLFKKLNPTLYLRTKYFVCQQTHSSRVVTLKKCQISSRAKEFLKADAIIFQGGSMCQKSVCLSVYTADCLPILLSSPEQNFIAVIHLGWQGSRGGLLQNLILSIKALKIDLSKVTVIFGPSINGSCYNIPMSRALDFKTKYKNYSQFIFSKGTKYYLSLSAFAFYQLIKMGFKPSLINWRMFCTHCQEKYFFSYRRGTRAQNIISYIYNNA